MSATTEPIPASVPLDANPPVFPPPDFPRRYNETDMQNAQNTPLSLSSLGHPPAPTMYPTFSEQPGLSLGHSSAQGFPPDVADMIPGPPSHAHCGGYIPVMNVDEFPLSSTSSRSQENSAGAVFPGPPLTAAPGTPSRIPEHPTLPQAVSSGALNSGRMQRRTEKKKRAEPPKDPRATVRLSDQRKSDDENIEALCKLFVPPAAEVKWKKDRLGMGAPQCSYFLCRRRISNYLQFYTTLSSSWISTTAF